MTYIATFFSHFGAIRFKKICDSQKLEAKIMPVPRNLSSSCGTCVRFIADTHCPSDACPEEVEQIVQVLENGYEVLYKAENS